MTADRIERVEVTVSELEEILERAKSTLPEKDYQKLSKFVEAYAYVTHLIGDQQTTIGQLRKLFFGSSEKTSKVFEEDERTGSEGARRGSAGTESSARGKKKPKGHGRNGADAYRGAERIRTPHESLGSGSPCPDCEKGKVYEQDPPGVVVRVLGQAPLQAKIWELEKFRCNLCGKVFTAKPPEGIGTKKYDETAGSMIALLKYGTGVPFHRLEGLQKCLGIPLPSSTQWDIVKEVAEEIAPAYEELIRQAAQAEVVYNDDTGMTVLSLKKEQRKGEPSAVEGISPERTGVFTSGIVSTREGERISLFFTGRRHAGENLEQVLAQRASEVEPPVQMCDGLSRNLPGDLKAILSNCLAHSRRYFVNVAGSFPRECRHVLDLLGKVYQNDALAKKRQMSPEERLRLHQADSAPVMKELHEWLTEQLEEKKVEPNSGLGNAINYMLKRWDRLTLFLRKPGAPLDNNICERALKKAILHRKNALFYKTENGARVGDAFMSLIHTCQLAGADPFDYLTELQRHHEALAREPKAWMPWNYRQALRSPPDR